MKESMENHHPDRKDFQIDRIILFTDAVFAIAITLLIIEIKVPEIAHDATDGDFFRALLQLLPKFMGFAVSFFIIGLYWFIHHKMFGYVINYTPKLIWLNLIFLFSIVLMPFSTAVYSEYSTEAHIHLVAPYAVYVINICFTGVMNYVLLNYIYNEKNGIAEYVPDKKSQVAAKQRAMAIPVVFLVSLLLTCIWPAWGRMFLFVIPVVIRMLAPAKKKKKPN
ncbi:MAG: TMEM175 family protein [Agriterribacter sp.]